MTSTYYPPVIQQQLPAQTNYGYYQNNIQIPNQVVYSQDSPTLRPIDLTSNMSWRVVNYNTNNKRILSPKAETSNKQIKTNKYWLSRRTEPRKRSSILAEDDTSDNNEPTTVERKSPPIFVAGVETINPLIALLNNEAKDNYAIKTLHNNEVKILPKNSEVYSKIVKALAEKQTEFYTYRPKEERLFRTVLKHMHLNTHIKDIKDSSTSLGHEVMHVWNIKQKETNIPLPVFFIDLIPKNNNKEIYNIKSLMNSIVEFEPPHSKNEIPQCQRFFCTRSPRCVKCTGSHLTKDCTRKERNNDVKCTNCNYNHPANYKGCIVYKNCNKECIHL